MSLIKRSDADSASVPLWHPNFRNFERLPDTKVVRTTFFVNVTAITLAASLLMLVGIREYRVMDLKAQIDVTQALIEKTTKDNTEAIKLSKAFETEAKKIAEAAAFAKKPTAPSAFILLLGKTLPKEVQLESADIRFSQAGGDQCVLRGTVAGTKDTASGAADQYVGTLRNSPVIGGKFQSVNMPSINPDPAGSFLRFEIVLKFNPPGKETKS